jgi:anti-anti-sigma factor
MVETAPRTPARPIVVTLPNEIDIGNAASVGLELNTALAGSPAAVIADMTATTFCDSTGLRALLLASKLAAAAGTELRLIPSHSVMRVIQLLGAEHALIIYTSLEQALKP